MPNLSDLLLSTEEEGSLKATLNYEGFEIEIRYTNDYTIRQLTEQCKIRSFTNGRRQEEPDLEKLSSLLTKHVIIGWKGVTLRKLAKFIPLKKGKKLTPAELDAEIPFEPSTLAIMVSRVRGFASACHDFAMDISNFQSATLEDELGNSKPTPAGPLTR